MLQALTAKGHLVTPATWSKAVLQYTRMKEPFYCPGCKKQVIFRAGDKVIPHFAHRHHSNCSNTGGESFYHMQGKLQLYQWLKKQYEEVQLEAYLPEINQRPDIYLKIAHRMIAIELQCSIVDPQIIRQRNKGYKSAGITPIWLLGANRFKRISTHKMKVNSFIIEFLQKFSSETSTQLMYYCPHRHAFFVATDLHFINHQHAITHLTHYQAHQIVFPQLFSHPFLSKQQLYKSWFYEKKRFRLGQGKQYGKELKWRKWVYKKGLYLEQLPPIIHLPVASQYVMNVPIWHWQSYFILDVLHPLPVGSSITSKEISRFLHPYRRNQAAFPLVHASECAGYDYLHVLKLLGYVKEIDTHTFQKVRQVDFPTHIEEALNADKYLLQQLQEYSKATDNVTKK